MKCWNDLKIQKISLSKKSLANFVIEQLNTLKEIRCVRTSYSVRYLKKMLKQMRLCAKIWTEKHWAPYRNLSLLFFFRSISIERTDFA